MLKMWSCYKLNPGMKMWKIKMWKVKDVEKDVNVVLP